MNFKTLYNAFCRFYYDFLNKQKIEKFNKSTKNNIISHLVSLNAIKGNHITAMDGVYICNDSVIESYSFIGFNSLISKTTIGRYNSIASNVNIGHGEHPLDAISTNSFLINDYHNILTSKACVIESDVWIGVGSIIRRGVTVGIGAVIGANSFVNKDVPPFAIVAGSPARIIRYRFDQNKINEILKSKWWELELEDAKEVIKKLDINTNEV